MHLPFSKDEKKIIHGMGTQIIFRGKFRLDDVTINLFLNYVYVLSDVFKDVASR